MLHQPTIEKLISMRLQGMVDGLEAIERDEAARDLTFEDKLALIVDRQYTWRQNLAFQQRLRRARLRGNACVEDIDYRAARASTKPPCEGLPRNRRGSRSTRIFSSPGRPGAGKAIWHRLWRKRPAATAIWCSTAGRRLCSAIWRWRGPTAVSGMCCCASRALMCWLSMTGR